MPAESRSIDDWCDLFLVLVDDDGHPHYAARFGAMKGSLERLQRLGAGDLRDCIDRMIEGFGRAEAIEAARRLK